MIALAISYLMCGVGLAIFFVLRVTGERRRHLVRGIYVLMGERLSEQHALAWAAAFIVTLWPLLLAVAFADAFEKP